jgi:hypothetical protein
MKKIFFFILCLFSVSCGINNKVLATENTHKKVTNKILNKYKNVITLKYGTATFSSIIYNDIKGNWKLIKIQNGKKNFVNLNKEPHFIGDSIIVETENELKKVNTKTSFVLDGTSINFKYKYSNEVYQINFNGEIEDFKKIQFELNYLKIINEIILDEKL